MANQPSTPEEVRSSKLVELRAKLQEFDAEILVLAEKEILNEQEELRWDDLLAMRSEVEPEFKKLETRAARAEEIKAQTYREIKGLPEVRRPVEEMFGVDVRSLDVRAARDGALRILNDHDSNYVLSSPAGDYLERTVRKDSDLARRIIATENDNYRSAWHKLMGDPNAALALEPDEQIAVRRMMQYRAASEGTTTAGGFAIPVFIDPSIILTDQETDNPFLTAARTVDVNTNAWKGISAAGMSWSFDTEAAEVSDDMVTIAQPSVTVYTARGFIPFSLEIGQDWPGFQAEMGRLLSIGYDELLIDKFSRGSGSGEPFGLRTVLETTPGSQVASTTDGAFGQEDIYKVWAALGQKYRRRASWMMSVDVNNRIRQMGTSTNFHAYSMNITQGSLNALFGRPVYESPYFPSFTGTTGSETRLVVGDLDNYVIARRQGMTVELVPHLRSSGSQRPTGQRGWFAWARIGGNVVNTSAFKILLNS
jgi:HK97 family phage major capsid protein